jgi:hypothetical protein
MPQGLTPERQLQWELWGWCDTRGRTKQKFHGPKLDYSPGEIAAVAEAISSEPAAEKDSTNMPTKNDIFPSKYLKAADLKGKPRVLTITEAPTELLKYQGREERKVVLHFAETKKLLPLNFTNWDSMVEVTGEPNSDNWGGHKIEVYPTQTEVRGETRACIRIRKPTTAPKKAEPEPKLKPALQSLSEQIDDDVLFEWEQEDRSGVQP